MKGKGFARVLLLFGFLLLVLACGFYIQGPSFRTFSERKILFPAQMVQIKSDTINGSLTIPFNVTEEGHVFATVASDPYGPAYTLYTWHFSASPNGQSIYRPATLKPGTYYLVQPFTLFQGLDRDYYALIEIYERIQKPPPYLTYTIASFMTGTTFTITGYMLSKHKNKNAERKLAKYAQHHKT